MLETVTQSTGDFQVDPDFYFWLDSPVFNVPYPWTVDVSGRLPGELLLEKKNQDAPETEQHYYRHLTKN